MREKEARSKIKSIRAILSRSDGILSDREVKRLKSMLAKMKKDLALGNFQTKETK